MKTWYKTEFICSFSSIITLCFHFILSSLCSGCYLNLTKMLISEWKATYRQPWVNLTKILISYVRKIWHWNSVRVVLLEGIFVLLYTYKCKHTSILGAFFLLLLPMQTTKPFAPVKFSHGSIKCNHDIFYWHINVRSGLTKVFMYIIYSMFHVCSSIYLSLVSPFVESFLCIWFSTIFGIK